MTVSQTIKRRIYISMPADAGLDDCRNEIKWKIVRKIEDLGYEAQIFVGPNGGQGLASGKAWNLENVDWVMPHCVAAVIIGLPKWRFSIDGQAYALATEFCQYEAAVAYTYRLPLLVIAEEGVAQRGIFNQHVGKEIILMPVNSTSGWLEEKRFSGPFDRWVKEELGGRRDVFLGYCGSSKGTAANIKRYLTGDLKTSVLDWYEDFPPAGSILDRIRDAARRSSFGIFLFTKDDKIESPAETAAPRDNVVFEAGFFAHAKGKDRVLIIREEGSKMPADLGGDIYAPLIDRADITNVEPHIKRFIAANL